MILFFPLHFTLMVSFDFLKMVANHPSQKSFSPGSSFIQNQSHRTYESSIFEPHRES